MCWKSIFPMPCMYVQCTLHIAQCTTTTFHFGLCQLQIIFCHSPFPAVRWVTFSLIWLHAPRRLSISVSSCLTSTCKRWIISEEKFENLLTKNIFSTLPIWLFVEQLADQSMSRCPELKQHAHTLTILLSLSPSPTLGGAGSQEVHTGSYNRTCAILEDVQNGEYKM